MLARASDPVFRAMQLQGIGVRWVGLELLTVSDKDSWVLSGETAWKDLTEKIKEDFISWS